MQIETIQSIAQWDAIAAEWNTLLGVSASNVPFLRHEYLRGWWTTLGGGEWPQGELYVVVARDEGGNLVGIAPLFSTHNREGKPALMLLGSIEVSDYLDLIARPGDVNAFVEALLSHLEGPEAPPWDALDWYNLPEDSPTLLILESCSRARGWACVQEPYLPSPQIILPGDWETYLAGLKKKQRHEIRRKMRRAANQDPPAQWYIVEDGATLEQQIEAFLGLMVQEAGKGDFLTSAMRTHMHKTAQVAFRAGYLQLAFLTVGHEKAAGYFNFDYGNRIYVYNSGIDSQFRSLSAGWVLLGHLLKWANEQGRAVFDFMRGDEDYKYRFGAVNQFVMRSLIQR